MTILILFGVVLGFVTYANAPLWAVTTIAGIAGLTILSVWLDELGSSDFHEPRNTYTSTSRQVVHMERPHKRFNDEDFD